MRKASIWIRSRTVFRGRQFDPSSSAQLTFAHEHEGNMVLAFASWSSSWRAVIDVFALDLGFPLNCQQIDGYGRVAYLDIARLLLSGLLEMDLLHQQSTSSAEFRHLRVQDELLRLCEMQPILLLQIHYFLLQALETGFQLGIIELDALA